jgi:DNA polymerase elongation subunit (family B)
MIKLFLDIETLPCEEKDREMIVSILKKKNSNAEKDPEQLFLETGFDGTFGRICCIAYIKEYQGGAIEKDVLRGDEKEILQKFWEAARDASLFIGHNILEFDLPFIHQRSMIHGVRPTQYINFAKYRSSPIYDTMKEWTKWAFNQGPKLDTLAKVLSLPTSKDDMDGSQVYPYFLDGKLDDICAYCMKDVILTRQVYYRMNFDEASEIPGIEEFISVRQEMSREPMLTATVTGQPTLLGDTDEIPF